MKTSLTHEQQHVVNTTDDNICSARPGTGKTHTLVEWVNQRACMDKNVLAVTFTRNARDEMQQRLKARMNSMMFNNHVKVCTFHSFAAGHIYKDHQRFGFSRRPSMRMPKEFLQDLAEATKNRWHTWDDSPFDRDQMLRLARTANLENLKDYDVHEAMTAYREWMHKRNYISFDLMQILLWQQPASFWQSLRHRHIIVDEFQDVDQTQLDIVLNLKYETLANVCVLGDPNQAIFEWRGGLRDAFPRALEEIVGSASTSLSKNFRSTQQICDFANKYVKEKMQAWDKTRGSEVTVLPQASKRELVGEWRDHVGAGSESAILCRYNRECLQAQELVLDTGTPCQITGGKNFFNAKHVKIALEYIERNDSRKACVNDFRIAKMLRAQAESPDQPILGDIHWLFRKTKDEINDLMQMKDDKHGAVISTIHKAKGKEWHNVLVFSTNKDLVQEKNVWYTAITRAKDNLVVGVE